MVDINLLNKTAARINRERDEAYERNLERLEREALADMTAIDKIIESIEELPESEPLLIPSGPHDNTSYLFTNLNTDDLRTLVKHHQRLTLHEKRCRICGGVTWRSKDGVVRDYRSTIDPTCHPSCLLNGPSSREKKDA